MQSPSTIRKPVEQDPPPPYNENTEADKIKKKETCLKTQPLWTDRNTINIEDECDIPAVKVKAKNDGQSQTTEMQDGKKHKGPISWLMYFTVMHTKKMLLMWFTIMIALTIVALIFWPSVEFYSDDSEALRVSGHPSNYASDRQTAFYNAYPGILGSRPADTSSLVHRRGAPSRMTRTKTQRLVAIYRSTNGDRRGVLEATALETIRDAELALQRSSTYQQYCTRDSSGRCNSVNSIVPAYFPSYSPGGNLIYDMVGSIVPNIALATNRILLAYADEVPFYYEPTIQTTPTKSRILRSSFRFGNAGDSPDEIKKAMYAAQDELRAFANDGLLIVCGNDKLLDQDLDDALTHDYILLTVSLLVLFVCMWVFLNSLYLAVCGLMVIAISIPLAVFVYSVVFQIDYFDAINLVAIFVSLGIAVDDIFVFTNFFKQAKPETIVLEEVPQITAPPPAMTTKAETQRTLADAGVMSSVPLHAMTDSGLKSEANIVKAEVDEGMDTQVDIEADPQHPRVVQLVAEGSSKDGQGLTGLSAPQVEDDLSLESETKIPNVSIMSVVETPTPSEAVGDTPSVSDTELMDRLQRSYRKSAKAIFLTSMTTAASVLSTLVSPLKVVDTFGIFMAILVMTNYVLVVTLYPCLVVEWARRYENGPGFMTTIADWCRCQNNTLRKICEYDIHEALCMFFATHYSTGVISTRVRRAIVAGIFGVILITAIVFTTMLEVSGDTFVVLSGRTNFQQWQDVSHTFGDQLRSRGKCTDCVSKIQSIQKGLSEVNLEGLLTKPVDLDPAKQYIPPPTNPKPAVVQDDAVDEKTAEVPETTTDIQDTVPTNSSSVEQAATNATETETDPSTQLLRFEGPIQVYPLETCSDTDIKKLFQARLKLDKACPSKLCNLSCQEAHEAYNESYVNCHDYIQPPRSLAVFQGYMSICSDEGYQRPAGNFSNRSPASKPTFDASNPVKPLPPQNKPQPQPHVKCGDAMLQQAKKVLTTCATFIAGETHCTQPCAVQLNAVQTQWSQCAATDALKGVNTTETGQLEWLLENCVAEKVVRLQRDRTVLVKLLWGVKDTVTEEVSSLRQVKLAEDNDDDDVLLPVADKDFNFYSSETQTELLKLCHAIQDDKKLSQQHPSSVRCVALALEEWAKARGLAFPLTGSVIQINGNVKRFLQSATGRVFDDYILWNNGKIAAVTVEVYTPFREGSDPFATYNYYHDWQRVVNNFNDKSESRAALSQSADAWEDAITQVTTVSGVGWSLSISALVAGLALLLFTQSPTLAVTSTLLLGSVVIVVLGLVWCFGWEIGMVEALTLTMLLGLAVDYFIHLSEEYIVNSQKDVDKTSSKARRVQVTQSSLGNIGASILFSCISTVGSVFVLFFADLVMLRRMGVVIGIAILISMTITLAVYAAALATWGPKICTRNLKRFGWCFLLACVIVGILVLVLYILTVAGVNIVAPNGTPLF